MLRAPARHPSVGVNRQQQRSRPYSVVRKTQYTQINSASLPRLRCQLDHAVKISQQAFGNGRRFVGQKQSGFNYFSAFSRTASRYRLSSTSFSFGKIDFYKHSVINHCKFFADSPIPPRPPSTPVNDQTRSPLRPPIADITKPTLRKTWGEDQEQIDEAKEIAEKKQRRAERNREFGSEEEEDVLPPEEGDFLESNIDADKYFEKNLDDVDPTDPMATVNEEAEAEEKKKTPEEIEKEIPATPEALGIEGYQQYRDYVEQEKRHNVRSVDKDDDWFEMAPEALPDSAMPDLVDNTSDLDYEETMVKLGVNKKEYTTEEIWQQTGDLEDIIERLEEENNISPSQRQKRRTVREKPPAEPKEGEGEEASAQPDGTDKPPKLPSDDELRKAMKDKLPKEEQTDKTEAEKQQESVKKDATEGEKEKKEGASSEKSTTAADAQGAPTPGVPTKEWVDEDAMPPPYGEPVKLPYQEDDPDIMKEAESIFRSVQQDNGVARPVSRTSEDSAERTEYQQGDFQDDEHYIPTYSDRWKEYSSAKIYGPGLREKYIPTEAERRRVYADYMESQEMMEDNYPDYQIFIRSERKKDLDMKKTRFQQYDDDKAWEDHVKEETEIKKKRIEEIRAMKRARRDADKKLEADLAAATEANDTEQIEALTKEKAEREADRVRREKNKFINYYTLLDIPRDATENQVKRAFGLKAKEYHPDVNRSENAATLFMQVQQAFETLKDPSVKFLYDEELKSKEEEMSKMTYEQKLEQEEAQVDIEPEIEEIPDVQIHIPEKDVWSDISMEEYRQLQQIRRKPFWKKYARYGPDTEQYRSVHDEMFVPLMHSLKASKKLTSDYNWNGKLGYRYDFDGYFLPWVSYWEDIAKHKNVQMQFEENKERVYGWLPHWFDVRNTPDPMGNGKGRILSFVTEVIENGFVKPSKEAPNNLELWGVRQIGESFYSKFPKRVIAKLVDSDVTEGKTTSPVKKIKFVKLKQRSYDPSIEIHLPTAAQLGSDGQALTYDERLAQAESRKSLREELILDYRAKKRKGEDIWPEVEVKEVEDTLAVLKPSLSHSVLGFQKYDVETEEGIPLATVLYSGNWRKKVRIYDNNGNLIGSSKEPWLSPSYNLRWYFDRNSKVHPIIILFALSQQVPTAPTIIRAVQKLISIPKERKRRREMELQAKLEAERKAKEEEEKKAEADKKKREREERIKRLKQQHGMQ